MNEEIENNTNHLDDNSTLTINKYEHVKERIEELSQLVIENDKIIENNQSIWNCYRDNVLKQLVIMFNFDFEAIENRFENLLGLDDSNSEHKVFGKNELRRHWGFLHSMRLLGKKVDEEYYIKLATKKEEMMKNKVYKIEESNDDFINNLFNTKISPKMMKEYESDLKKTFLNKKNNDSFPLNVTIE